jgi:hypothetical protein
MTIAYHDRLSSSECAAIYVTVDYFEGLFPLPESGLFLALWGGGSALHCLVINAGDEKPRIILDQGTVLFPEITYSENEMIDITIASEKHYIEEDDDIHLVDSIYRYSNGLFSLKAKCPWEKRSECREQ